MLFGDKNAAVVLYLPFTESGTRREGGAAQISMPLAEAQRIAASAARPVYLIAPENAEEEKQALAEKIGCVRVFLNLSSSRPGTVILKRKGLRRFSVHIFGSAAAACQPQEGKNALSRACSLIHAFSAERRAQCIGPSAAAYGLQCDGAPGEISAECRFFMDIYGENEAQLSDWSKQFCTLAETDPVYGTTAEVEEVLYLPPFCPKEADFALFDLLRRELRGNLPAAEMSRACGVTGMFAASGAACLDGLGAQKPETILRLIDALPEDGVLRRPNLRFAAPLTDRCLLQRECPVLLWGTALPDRDVTVVFDGETQCTHSNAAGEWRAEFSPRKASLTPVSAEAFCGEERIFIEDILIGDLWLLGGQSNMEHVLCNNPQVTARNNADRFAASSELPIRILIQHRLDSFEDPEAMKAPQTEFREPVRSMWRKPDPAVLEECSTVGWFFADAVSRALDRRVPVGILSVAAGSAALMHLISSPLAESEAFTRHANAENLRMPPAGIYNTMTVPVLGLQAKGMLFYQGESDQVRWETYDRLLAVFAKQVRTDFGEDIPFFYVQLSSHPIWTHVAQIRERQTEALAQIPNSGMVVARDLGWRQGDMETPHPNYKKEVGLRLADLALARCYGIGNEAYCTAPVPVSADFTADGVTVRFSAVGEGLTGAATGFEVEENGVWRSACAIINSNDAVFVPADKPSALRFAHAGMAGSDAADLRSSSGYEAAAFLMRKEK